MENDFLGLKWKSSTENVKGKTSDIGNNSGYSSLSNKLSSRSHFSPIISNSTQEDVQRKSLEGTLPSPVFIPISSSYAFDLNSKFPAHLAENNIKMTGKNLPYLDERNALQTSISPAPGFMNVEAALRSKAESSAAPAPLTIIYDNAVYTYDDISPAMAEAVMRMADTKEASKPVASDTSSNQSHCFPQIGSSKSLQYNSATYIPRTVPQARRASLNRFMEKRKDRYQY